LVWNPRELPVRGKWFEDGPLVPVEFTRESGDHRMTLVIDQQAKPVRVLWAQMLSTDIGAAQKALRDREGIPDKNWKSRIGSWRRGEPTPESIPDLPQWAEARCLDAVIWTALEPKFKREYRSPSVEEVISHLRGLSGVTRERAKEYIERAPRQIDTDYRRQIEAVFGWSCRDDGTR